jgi:hypothetical protein
MQLNLAQRGRHEGLGLREVCPGANGLPIAFRHIQCGEFTEMKKTDGLVLVTDDKIDVA